MIFALLYCLFFVLDILFHFRFLAFGLMPIDAFKAAIFLFTGIFFLKIPASFSLNIDSAYKKLWIIGIFMLFVKSIMSSIRIENANIKQIQDFFYDSPVFTSFLMVFFAILFLFFVLKRMEKHKLHQWMFLANTAILLGFILRKYGWDIGMKLPFRFAGFYDLPMLFTVLVCVDIIIKEKFKTIYQFDYT